MVDPVRIDVFTVRQRVLEGSTLLVCGYEKPRDFRKHALEGAISLQELEARLPALNKDQAIVFY